MRKIKITCDSTCDLTPALYRACGVESIGLGVSLGDDFRRDGFNVTPSQLFEYVEKSGQLPKTAAISVGEYLDLFQKYVDAGCHVIHISLSSELSATHHNALLAAEEVGHVTVIDSRSLSSGSGHLVLLAAELAGQGKTPAEIEAALLEARERLDVSFVLQTLEYLHKGGRCSGVAAFGANLLKLRPEIEVSGGKMQVGRKYRGDMDRSIAAYIRGRLEGREDIQPGRIFVTHSGVPRESLEKATALVRELQPGCEVIETTAGCTISSHCGPNCLGVLFFRK